MLDLDAAHGNFIEFQRLMTARAGGEVSDDDGVLLGAAVSDFPAMVNVAVRTDAAAPAEEVLAKASAFFGDRRRGYTLQLRDLGEEDLREAAEAAGLLYLFEAPEMVLEDRLEDRPAPAGAQLRRVEDARGIRDFATVNGQAYETYEMPAEVVESVLDSPDVLVSPDVVAVVAYVDGAPAAAAMTLVSLDVAGVYWVGTRDDARGRGLAEACTRYVTNAGFDLGGTFASLQASPMGEPIYRRLGYRDTWRYVAFLAGPPG